MAFFLLGLLLVVGFFPQQAAWLGRCLCERLADWEWYRHVVARGSTPSSLAHSRVEFGQAGRRETGSPDDHSAHHDGAPATL
jgi:hypothetical protein